MLSPQRLFARLDELGLAHRTVEHAPVFTVEQAKEHRGVLPGHHIKNLFLIHRIRKVVIGYFRFSTSQGSGFIEGNGINVG